MRDPSKSLIPALCGLNSGTKYRDDSNHEGRPTKFLIGVSSRFNFQNTWKGIETRTTTNKALCSGRFLIQTV